MDARGDCFVSSPAGRFQGEAVVESVSTTKSLGFLLDHSGKDGKFNPFMFKQRDIYLEHINVLNIVLQCLQAQSLDKYPLVN